MVDKSAIKKKDRDMLAKVTSMLLGLIVAVAFLGGIFSLSLTTLGVPLVLLSAILFFVLHYSITEFKMTLMNIMFFVVILVGLGSLLSTEIVSPMVTGNLLPVVQGIIGAGVVGTLMSLANAKFGKGR